MTVVAVSSRNMLWIQLWEDFFTRILKSTHPILIVCCLIKRLFSRHDDLKEMLDSNKDSLKLEAMKRIIGVKVLNSVFI